ncbi:MAG: methionyl-tRNA formyltransferase [Phycisphaera sp.]|nr:MAG: methionyl-tRNA formyltransferase [Phycisphaera sp.]
MRVVFFGSGAFGVPTLRALAERHEVAAIVTQPDRPAGRGKKLSPTPIAAEAEALLPGVELFKPEKVNTPDIRDHIRGIDAEAWVVIAFGQKLGQKLLAEKFAINLHASLLPRWRGAAPINAAILAGDESTGVSVITLAEEMDAGLVLGQASRPLDPSLTIGELHEVLARDGVPVVLGVLERHAAGTLTPIEQDADKVTLAPKLSKADGWIDFADTASACRNRVHGLTPWPGVSINLAGTALKLLRVAAETSDHTAGPGTLIDPAGLIACGHGTALRLITIQPAGKKPMDFAAFANGRSLTGGELATPERQPCARSGT